MAFKLQVAQRTSTEKLGGYLENIFNAHGF